LLSHTWHWMPFLQYLQPITGVFQDTILMYTVLIFKCTLQILLILPLSDLNLLIIPCGDKL
jgi:hypothetical protein